MIIKIEDKSKELQTIRKDGRYFETFDTGLDCLDNKDTGIYKAVKGYPLFVGGYPHHGKSEFTTELAISLSKRHRFKWCVYLGEAGKVEIAMAEICSKYMGKAYFELSENDILEAHSFISEHFIFIDLESFTIKQFYAEVDKASNDLGIKFDGTILDPFNDVSNESGGHGGTHIWMEEDLKYIRRQSSKHMRLDVIVMHVQEIKPILDKESNNWYVRPAMPSEWANGQVIQRRAFTMLLVYKIPEWMRDENGNPYGENRTFIINQKAKPKGSGRIGKAAIHWDGKRNRYFENTGGFNKYMLENNSSQTAPKLSINVNFDKIIGEKDESMVYDNDENPF